MSGIEPHPTNPSIWTTIKNSPLLHDPACAAARPTMDRWFALLAVALVAIWAALYPFASRGGQVVLAVIGLTILFGCWKTRRATMWIVPAMYLPYLWLFVDWQFWPWNNYRWHWIGMLWQLPGLVVAMPVHPLPDFWFQLVTTVATIAIFLIVVLVARRSALTAVVVGICVLAASSVNSSICLALYRF